MIKNELRRSVGITLVALVVTIIVLLILAGVTISITLGENGIITKAKEAKEKTEIAQIEEQIDLAQIGNLQNDGTINITSFIQEVEKIKGVDEVQRLGNKVIVKYKGIEKIIDTQMREQLPDNVLEEIAQKIIDAQTEQSWVIGIDAYGNPVDMNLWRFTNLGVGWNLNSSLQPETDNTNGYPESGLKNGTIQGEIPAYIAKKENGVIDKRFVLGMNYTFANLSGLQSLSENLQIPHNIQTAKAMFKNCSSLVKYPRSMKLPDECSDVQSIFYGCTNLKELPNDFAIPSKVTSYAGMFYNCTSLTGIPNSFVIHNGVTSLDHTFAGCKNLAKLPDNFTIPENITNIEGSFLSCLKLSGKVVIDTNPVNCAEAITELGYQGTNLTIYFTEKCRNVGDIIATGNNFDKLIIETVITSKTVGDNMNLYGRIIANRPDAVKTNNNWLIMLPGYKSPKETLVNLGTQIMGGTGYNILIIDQRGHGESNSKPTTLGWLEGKDLVDWSNYIASINQNSKIVLYGQSMGGATVTVASGETLPSNVVGLIEDSGYTSIKEVVEYDEASPEVSETHKQNLRDSVETMKIVYPTIDFLSTSNIEQVKKCTLPILFLHGGNDVLVPVRMCEELYNAATLSSHREKYISPNVGHIEGIHQDSNYPGVMNAFLQTINP